MKAKRDMTEDERGQIIAALLHHANFCRDLSTLQADGMTDRIREQFGRQAVADESLADIVEQAESITVANARPGHGAFDPLFDDDGKGGVGQ